MFYNSARMFDKKKVDNKSCRTFYIFFLLRAKWSTGTEKEKLLLAQPQFFSLKFFFKRNFNKILFLDILTKPKAKSCTSHSSDVLT